MCHANCKTVVPTSKYQPDCRGAFSFMLTRYDYMKHDVIYPFLSKDAFRTWNIVTSCTSYRFLDSQRKRFEC